MFLAKPPSRKHPLERAALVDWVNGWLEKAWARGVANRPSLDPDRLWAKALRSAPAHGEAGGRSAENVADFRLRLEQLCASLQGEAALNPLGLTIAHGQLVRIIRQRLELGAQWVSQPELCATPLAPPILVVGQMRGGTTRVHRLLSADPAHVATRFCDSWNPVPQTPDLRRLQSAVALFGFRLLDPWIDSIHPFGAARPDEELGWLTASLHHPALEAQWRIPSFTAWSEARDPAPIYREFVRILATDAAHRGNANRPRVMKVPQFAEDLQTLLKQFPDARLVVARRDREDVLASTASFIANQMTIQSDTADMDWIETEWRRKIALREARIADALADFSGPIAEVDYAALDANWEAEMAIAYRELGLELTDGAMAAMRAEQGRASVSKHQSHQRSYRAFARA